MEAPLLADGLCIRPFADQDIAEFVTAVRESVATAGAWMPWCVSDYSSVDAKSWFDQCSANLSAGYAYDVGIFSPDGRTFYGGIAINQINREHKFGNIGYWVRQSRQRQGIALRAVRIIAAFGFDFLKLTRLEIVAPEDNIASRGVAERAGAAFECVARNRLVIKGRPVAAVVYSLTP